MFWSWSCRARIELWRQWVALESSWPSNLYFKTEIVHLFLWLLLYHMDERFKVKNPPHLTAQDSLVTCIKYFVNAQQITGALQISTVSSERMEMIYKMSEMAGTKHQLHNMQLESLKLLKPDIVLLVFLVKSIKIGRFDVWVPFGT